MFWKWAAQGAQIGTVAFFILIVFALLCGAVLAVVALLTRFFSVEEGEDGIHRG